MHPTTAGAFCPFHTLSYRIGDRAICGRPRTRRQIPRNNFPSADATGSKIAASIFRSREQAWLMVGIPTDKTKIPLQPLIFSHD